MMQLRISNINKSQGFSLVELMIAALLSLIIMVGVVQIFISNKHTYNTQQGLSQVQESGRFAMTFLGEYIRFAGYTGCGNLERIDTFIQANPPPISGDFDMGGSLIGYEAGAGWTNPVPTSDPDYFAHVAGTDVLVIRGMSPGGLTLVGNMGTDNANIQINGNPDNYEADDILVITDCQAADVFCANSVSNWDPTKNLDKVTITHSTACNVSPKLSKPYGDDATIARFIDISLYIGQTPTGPALVVIENGDAEVLVEGISDMQMLFGVDDSGNDRIVDQYLPADNGYFATADNWGQVLSVRVGVVAESTNEAFPENIAVSLALPGGNVNFDDRFIRQSFDSTIALRNRLP